jgi:adenylyl- and sulfurtransferase ThiI
MVTKGDGVMDMVERIALAIYAESPASREACMAAARTAVEVMREPTDEMMTAFHIELDRWQNFECDSHDVYRAMIDSILKRTRETA